MAAPGWFPGGGLFPTKLSFVIFVSYMALFINQGILVTASKDKHNTYNYNTTTVVMLAECVKLLTAVALYIKDESCTGLFKGIQDNFKLFLLYFVPSGLYCLYNNLAFVNLATYDPTTYSLLLQFRVVVTGVVFQILFKKKLSKIQWLSLFLLTIGCIIKEVRHDGTAPPGASSATSSSTLNIGFILILVQVFCSCFAGVYNEYLMKDTGCDVHLMLQNTFMYTDSILCNIFVLAFRGNLATAFTTTSLASVMNVKVIAIILNSAGIGIITSLFLKSLNSILKTFASALELMFTAILSCIIFGIAIDIYTVIAIGIVTIAIFVYSRNPVVNLPKNQATVIAETTGETKTAQSV